MEVIKLLGSVLGLSFVAGINLYATVLALGLGIKFGFVHLPPELASLEVLSHPSVLGAAAIAYLMEFVADKIPWVDSFWDSFHTLIRPVGAALLGMAAVGSVDPALQVAVILLCGGIALSSHSTKAGIRLVANHTPEPVTNISLSISEDLLAIFGSWLAVAHPQFMLGLTLSFLVLFALVAPTIFRLLRVEVMALIALIRSPFSTLDTSGHIMFDGIPDRLARHIPDRHSHTKDGFCIRCVSGKEMETGRNYLGFLCLKDDALSFVLRKGLRVHHVKINLSDIDEVGLTKRLLMDRLFFRQGLKTSCVYLFRDRRGRGEKIVETLQRIKMKRAAAQEAVPG